MTKKIALIIGILIVVGLAAVLILGSEPAEEGESRIGFSIRDYLPFGRSDEASDIGSDFPTESEDDEDGGSSPSINQPAPRLRKISSEPVAGAAIFEVGTTSVVRFVEKGTGNVYEANSENVLVERLTNTTIPKIVRAFWLPGGSAFLAQTLIPETEIIETSFVKLNKNSAATSTESLTPYGTTISRLPTGIKELAIKPDGSKIFYYTVNNQGSSWYVSNPDGTGDSLVFSHPLTEWLPTWTSGNNIVMQTKRSYAARSRSFVFNTQSRSLQEAEGSPLESISKNTLSEKCAGVEAVGDFVFCAFPKTIPPAAYPDDWYKGKVSTDDIIERVDAKNDIYYQIANLSSLSGQKIDVVDLALSPDESHLIFRNKIDGYLWMLRIED